MVEKQQGFDSFEKSCFENKACFKAVALLSREVSNLSRLIVHLQTVVLSDTTQKPHDNRKY